MIGSGLKKLAKENGMTIAKGIAYGSLRGYAASLSEGAGWKQIVFATAINDSGKKTQFMDAVGAVVEGYYAAESIHQLAEREGVDMPICRCAYEVLYEGKSPRDVVGELMGRAKKDELLENTWM